MTTKTKSTTTDKNADIIAKLRAENKALKAESAKDTITINGKGGISAHGNVIHQLSKEIGTYRKAYLETASRKDGLAFKRKGLELFASLSLVLYTSCTCNEGQLNDALKNLGVKFTISGGTKNSIVSKADIFPVREFAIA